MKSRSMSPQIPVAVLALVIVACSSVSGTRENSSAMGASIRGGTATASNGGKAGTAGAVAAIGNKIGANKRNQ